MIYDLRPIRIILLCSFFVVFFPVLDWSWTHYRILEMKRIFKFSQEYFNYKFSRDLKKDRHHDVTA